jgi:hypothetical protein
MASSSVRTSASSREYRLAATANEQHGRYHQGQKDGTYLSIMNSSLHTDLADDPEPRLRRTGIPLNLFFRAEIDFFRESSGWAYPHTQSIGLQEDK